MSTVEEKLEELKGLDKEKKTFQLEKQARIDDILTDEIREKLAKVDAYYESVFGNLDEFSNYIEHEIKTAVLAGKVSVKGVYHAIYVKGHVTWDSKKLDGYAIAHPEINEARKTGKPSVRIKK